VTPPAVSRRAAVAGALAVGAAVATGCEQDAGPGATASATATPTPTLLEPADPDREADVATVGSALDDTVAALAVVEAVGQRHPQLRPAVEPVAAVHRAHRDVLADAAPEVAATSPSATAPTRPARALALVRSTEETTRTRLEGWALDARSGTLARLLAGMAAGVSQQASLLPERPPRRGGGGSGGGSDGSQG
jgi:hypothetical protein